MSSADCKSVVLDFGGSIPLRSTYQTWNWESQANPLAWGARDHRFESDIPYNGGLDAVAGSTPAFGISFLERNVPVVEIEVILTPTFSSGARKSLQVRVLSLYTVLYGVVELVNTTRFYFSNARVP